MQFSVRKTCTSREYYEFYIQQGDVLLSSLSIKSLGPHLEHLGISESAGWQAISDGSEIRFLNPTGALALTYNISTHILRDINTGLIATDMTQKLPPCYSSFLDLDPHAQLWKASASSVPSRITLPTFGMTFEIRNGKIWGTGEWEGFQLAKEQHLSALRGFGAKLVLHHEKLGTKVLVAEGEMSSSLDLTKPMSFKTHTDSKKKLLCLSVDTKKRLISTNREEDLYLARLFYHLGRPKAAMRCLEKCKGSNPWTLEQLRSLKTLLNDAEKRTTLSDRSVYLKAALLGINSRKAPYKKWSGTTTSEKSELNALNFTISSSAVDPYWTQITRIASPSLRLTLEEESMLHRLPTTELQVPTSSKKILDTCLLSADHFDREKISLKRPVQLDLFDHTTIPFTENWDSLSSHFLDFYAIATQGSEKQKQQLALWVKGLIFSTNISSDFAFQQKNGFAILFLRLLAMNHQQIAELPVMTSEICADEKNFTKSCEEILKSIKTVKISSEKESVAPFGSVSFSHRPVSLRKKKLMLSRLTGDTQLQSKTDTFTEIADTEKTTPLSKKSDVLFTQGKSPTEPPLSSLIPLDPKGGKTYDLAFDRFATHLKDVQKAKHSAPIWEISPENLDLLHKDLAEDTSGQIPILAKLFRESQQALIKKARTLGLDKEAVSIRELEEASRFVAPIRWSDLLFLFAKRDANAYCLRQPHFTQAQAQELFEDTAKCLALQTQLQKAEKAKELVEELQKTPDPKKTSQLKQLLTGTRDYPVDRFPAILLFEAVTGMQLREDQLQNLEKLGDPNQSWLIEAIMGSGKSEVLIPLFAQTIADGQHLSFAVMPKEQMLSGGTRLEKKLRQYFEQNSIQIDWNNTSLENLQAIHARLKEAIEKKEVVRLYADELQQFFLQEQAVWNSRFQGNPDAMPILQEFSAIRKLLKEKGVALVDEVHLQLMRKRECQKPLGEKVPVNASFCHVTADLQLLLVQDPTIQQTFRFEFSKNPQKTAVPFSAELHQKEFIRLLSTSFSRKRYEKDLGKQQKVLAFLQSPLEAPISLDTTFTEEEKIALAFARGQIQTILPSTLSKKWGQEYGLFPAQNRNEAPSLLAGPYRGLGRPVIGSTFATPDELLAYTIQSYLVEGLPKAQIAQQISSLVTRARREAATYRRPIDKTAGYQEYRQLIGETQLQQPGFAFDEEKDLDAIKKHLEENPERLIYFLKRFVLSEVSQYPTTTIANGYSFVDLFHATKAVSGTLQAAPTFHQSFRRALKPEIEAEAFALITRDNHKPICLQEKIEGIPLLKQLFSQRSKTTPRALIDQAGLIKEPPFVIAQQLLELTSTSDPKIDRIIYFEEDQLLSLERGKTTPTKYHPDACPPDTSFTFYDQAHATGTDIQQMQKAQALVTLGENTTFGDAIQAAFRMRGLDTLQQSVILVTSHELTSSLKAHLKKEPSDWNAADVLSHTKHIQVKIAEEENCKAVLDKLRNLFIKTCKEEMESETQSDQAKAELFQMTLRESRMDPLAAYTSKNELVDTKAIFTKIQIEYEKKLQGKIPPEKLRSMLGQMDTIIQEATDPTNPLVPEKILSKPNTTEAMEVEMLQEQQMELNTEQEQEQQQQQQKDLSVIPVDFATSGLPGQKTPLFTPEAAETIDLEKQSTQTTLPEDSFKDSSSIYSFSALAHFGIQKKADKTIDQGTLDQLTKDFPKKILFSLHATIAHSECAPFRKNQLTLDKLLLVPDPTNPKEPYCIALSKAESELWYQAIQNKKLPKGWEGSCLFSVEKEANAGEKEDGICVENEEIPFPIQELRSSFFDPSLTPFEQIIAKTKWIMGETELYHGKEEAYLTHWFQSLGPKNMEKIFQSWFQISRKPYTTSLLERFFKNALEKSIAVSEDGSTSTIISPTVEAPKKPLKISKTLDRSSEITKKDSTTKQKLSFTRQVVAVLFFPFYAVTMALSWPLRWLWKRLQK